MKDSKKFFILIGVLLLLLIVVFGYYGVVKSKVEDGGVSYSCDVKHFKLRTNIVVSDEDGNEVGTISGNILKLITDPLSMEKDGEVIAFASDNYNIIGQDDHALISNGEVALYMQGGFDLIGNNYKVYDKNHELLATIRFDAFSLSGKLMTPSNVCIAEYFKKPFFKDYTVKIYDDSVDRNALLLLFASYYSDYSTDDRAQNN